jgi:hypothetical protein
MAHGGGTSRFAVLVMLLSNCAQTTAPPAAPTAEACAQATQEPTRPDPSQKETDARRLIELSGGAELANKSIDQMIATFKKTLPAIDADLWQRFREEVDTSQFVEMAIPLYVEKMSHESILAAVGFMETPAGQKYVRENGDLAIEMQGVGMKWGTIVTAQVIEKLKASGYSPD